MRKGIELAKEFQRTILDIIHGHACPMGFRCRRVDSDRVVSQRIGRLSVDSRGERIRAHCTDPGVFRSIDFPVREQNDPSMLLLLPPRGCAQHTRLVPIVHTHTHVHYTYNYLHRYLDIAPFFNLLLCLQILLKMKKYGV